MKKDEIYSVVENTFKKIDKLFRKIIIDFSTEDIQEFRLEIKKLRAFFNLLDMDGNGDIQYKATREMKTFYGYIGIIRNLQLQLEKVNNYFENSTENIPTTYIVKLEKELEYWKKNTKNSWICIITFIMMKKKH
jgi:CHAD domain-containing protein